MSFNKRATKWPRGAARSWTRPWTARGKLVSGGTSVLGVWCQNLLIASLHCFCLVLQPRSRDCRQRRINERDGLWTNNVNTEYFCFKGKHNWRRWIIWMVWIYGAPSTPDAASIYLAEAKTQFKPKEGVVPRRRCHRYGSYTAAIYFRNHFSNTIIPSGLWDYFWQWKVQIVKFFFKVFMYIYSEICAVFCSIDIILCQRIPPFTVNYCELFCKQLRIS